MCIHVIILTFQRICLPSLNSVSTTDESNNWSFCFFFVVFSPRTQTTTMWRHDQTNDFAHIQLCFFATSDATCFLGTDTPEPIASPAWENFTASCSLCRYLFKEMPKKCVRVGFHSKFAEANISRVWKLQNVGPVYECLTLTRTNKNTGVIWNDLICIQSAGTIKIHQVNGVRTNTAIMIILFFRMPKE